MELLTWVEGVQLDKWEATLQGDSEFNVRLARIADVDQLTELVEQYR